MTPKDREHYEGIIIKAVQSGKRETSGLVAEIMSKLDSKLEEKLEPLINKYVNGKIVKLIMMPFVLSLSLHPSPLGFVSVKVLVSVL